MDDARPDRARGPGFSEPAEASAGSWIGRLAAAVVVLTLAAFVVTTWRLFIAPPTGDPAGVDAVVALGGEVDRIDRAVEVATEVDAALVLSLGAVGPSPEDEACEELSARNDLDVFCFEPRPVNTKGEARAIAALAEEEDWEAVAVVTSTSHLTRARMLVERCWDGRLEMVDAGRSGSDVIYPLLHEWGGVIDVVTTPGC